MTDDTKDRVLNAALAHVPFDGWSDRTLRAAIAEAGVMPKGWQRRFSRAAALIWRWPITGAATTRWSPNWQAMDLGSLRFRDRIAACRPRPA
jgi:ubiquinone biosynthesis protein COQ9